MLKFAKATLAALALLAAATSFAAAPFRVEKEAGSGKDPVSLASLQCAGDVAIVFRRVLMADLERSGYFTIDGGRYGSSFTVSGSATGQGASLSTRIRVAWPGGAFDWGDSTAGLREARWQAHRLSDEIVRRVKGKPGMSASRIALIGKEGGGGFVAVCDSDGASLQKFPLERTSPLSPYFSPDGRYIHYTSFVRNYACVYRVLVSGGQREPLANFTGTNSGGAVSPDGRFVAAVISQPGNPELFVINMGTRKATRLTRTPRAAEASPTWSPDGQRIAYVSDADRTPQIYVIDSASKTARRVSGRGSQNVAPSWGPDGRIAWCSKQGNYQIVVYNPATGETQTVSPADADYEDPSWAPDGRHIVCSRRDGRTCSLWVLDTEGDDAVKLSLPSGDWRSPEWSDLLR